MCSNAAIDYADSVSFERAPTGGPARRIFKRAGLLAVMLCLAIAAASAWAQTEQPPAAEPEISRKELLNAAYGSLWRLQRSIERDGFYSARVALNIWRSNAIDAGIFKQSEYDEYKRQIYEKSIQSSLACIETAVANENFSDARRCLHTWKMHSQEIETFDPERFEEMQKQIEEKSKAEKTVSE
jgi:hypothetical protein